MPSKLTETQSFAPGIILLISSDKIASPFQLLQEAELCQIPFSATNFSAV
jgi:hypothetical protein